MVFHSIFFRLLLVTTFGLSTVGFFIMAPVQRLAAAAAALLASVSPAYALFQDGSDFTPCDSPVYCHGELLKQVELARPFSDSKTFVDL